MMSEDHPPAYAEAALPPSYNEAMAEIIKNYSQVTMI